jgi:Ca2+-binding EF-hand superfamily protein
VALFKTIDANHDRALTREELIMLCKSSGLDNGEAAAKCLEDGCDANHDDKVTFEEWKTFWAKEEAKGGDESLGWFEELACKLQTRNGR